MKTVRKLLAAALAIVMLFAFGTVAFADTTYTVTVDCTETGHTYTAYQIFSGTLDEDGVLSDIQWGAGINGANFLGALKDDAAFKNSSNANIFADCTTAADVADAYAAQNLADDADWAQEFAKVAAGYLGTAAGNDSSSPYEITGLSAGYYIVTDALGSESPYAASRFILEVVADVEVDPKSNAVPESDKTVDGAKGTAAYAIGDAVPFVLTATLPDDGTFGQYASYKLVFNDTLDAGLTAPAAKDITVKCGSDDITSYATVSVSGQVITVTLNNVKSTDIGAEAEDVITVSYSAVLNSNAVVTGTDNTFVLDFSNNPADTSSMGELPEKVVTDYLFDLTVNKSYEGTPASQAGFTLYDSNNTAVGSEVTVANGVASWTKLPDGTYTLKETTTPAGYNTMPDKTFTVTSTIDDTGDRTAIVVTEGSSTTASENFSVTLDSGLVETDVLNTAGALLPSTGGFGTTLLIVCGCVLFLGTAIVLVTKKRMYNAGC